MLGYGMSMTDDATQNALMTLAFSVHSNPGAYALIIGSGVSVPSGIPTAWGVRKELARRVAIVNGEDPGTLEDPIAWYQRRYGGDAEYQELLQELAHTQTERKNLLQGFFEPTPEDVQAGRKKPTAAHHAIAQLALSGHIRVILTLNFDHLIEQALRDVGLSPIVLATPADFKGREPLHTPGVRVIHLHGEYLNPTSMLNTNDELGNYTPETQEILENVIRDYGLIIAGWSATYDPGLREAIARQHPRYTMAWIAPHGLTNEAERLCINQRGITLATSADDAFGRLNDAVTALHARQARHHLTVPAAIETAKRDLMGATVAIGVHDTFKTALDDLHRHDYFTPENHARLESTVPYAQALGVLEEKSKLPVALTAVLAYWGRSTTMNWWLNAIPRLAEALPGAGQERWSHIRRLPAGAMFYAAGIALTAAENWSHLAELLRLPGVDKDRPLSHTLDGARLYGEKGLEPRLYEWLNPILKDALTLSSPELEEAWQLFEIFRLGNTLREQSNFDRLTNQIRNQLQVVRNGGEYLNTASANQLLQESSAALAQSVRLYAPHLLTRETGINRFTVPVADRLIAELDRTHKDSTDPRATVLRTDIPALAEIVRAVNTAAGNRGRDIALDALDRHRPESLVAVWLDHSHAPQRGH